MKKWERMEVLQDYTRLTTVFENGDYIQQLKTNNGVIFNEYKTNLYKMGWLSVGAFLKEKKHFKRVGNSPLEIRIIYEDGTAESTRINATIDEAKRYYIGNVFNVGVVSDILKKCVDIEII